MSSPLHKPAPHESAALHVTGSAAYTDDLPEPPGLLHVAVVASQVAHGRITRVDPSAALAIPGVHGVWFHGDVPGDAMIGAIVHDEVLLADGVVHSIGQAIAVVAADSFEGARAAAEAVVVEVDPLPAIVGIEMKPNTARRVACATSAERAALFEGIELPIR